MITINGITIEKIQTDDSVAYAMPDYDVGNRVYDYPLQVLTHLISKSTNTLQPRYMSAMIVSMLIRDIDSEDELYASGNNGIKYRNKIVRHTQAGWVYEDGLTMIPYSNVQLALVTLLCNATQNLSLTPYLHNAVELLTNTKDINNA